MENSTIAQNSPFIDSYALLSYGNFYQRIDIEHLLVQPEVVYSKGRS